MNKLEEIMEKRDAIISIAAKHGGQNVRIFGSVVRGEETDSSDVDVLIDLVEDSGLLDMAAILIELEDLLDCDVDVVTERGLRKRVRHRVLEEAIPL